MSLFAGEAYPQPQAKDSRILVAGVDRPAVEAAAAVEAAGGRPIVLSLDQQIEAGDRRVIDGELVGLIGLAGAFTAFIDVDGGLRALKVGGVVLAGEPMSRPAGAGCNLADEGAVAELVKNAGGRKLALLTGFWSQTIPQAFGRVITLAERLAEAGDRVFVFAPQAKVAADGLEEAYRRARQAGVVVTRLREPPEITAGAGGLQIEFEDPILPGRVGLTVEAVVADPPPAPDPAIVAAGEALGLMFGPDGWPSPDNLLFPPPRTSRAGVWAVGGARGPDGTDLADDLKLLTAELVEYLTPAPDSRIAVRAASERRECATCLTCFRACPVGAIGWDLGPVVMESVCLECGQCAAVCPAAIIKPLWDDEAALQDLLAAPGGGELLLACARIPEENLAGLPPGVTVLRLSCAGRVSEEILLRLVAQGWDRVVVAACHESNCRSLTGSRRAERMAAGAKKILADMGLDADRVVHLAAAPNQAFRLRAAFERGEG